MQRVVHEKMQREHIQPHSLCKPKLLLKEKGLALQSTQFSQVSLESIDGTQATQSPRNSGSRFQALVTQCNCGTCCRNSLVICQALAPNCSGNGDLVLSSSPTAKSKTSPDSKSTIDLTCAELQSQYCSEAQ